MIQRLLLTAILTALLVVGFALPTSYANPLSKFQKTRDFYLSVAMGFVPGYTIMEKFGAHEDLQTASSFEVVWDAGLTYTPPTEARLHNVVSGLAADTGTLVSGPSTMTGGNFTLLRDSSADFVSDSVAVGDAVLNDSNVMIGFVTAITNLNELVIGLGMKNPGNGLGRPGPGVQNFSIFAERNVSGDSYRIVRDASTGVSILHLLGQNGSGIEIQEFVLLNGIGVVATSKLYLHQYRGKVFSTSSAVAASDITSTAQVDGTLTLEVLTPNNQTEMTPYPVPMDKTGYVLAWRMALSKKQAATSSIHLWQGNPSSAVGISRLLDEASINSTGSSYFFYVHPVPIPVAGGEYIWIEADTDSNGSGVAGGFTILLVDNPT